MTRQAFITWKPRGAAIDILTQAMTICEDYRRQGYDLTLRQLYYQFVARDLIENNQRSYKRLGSIIDQGRLAGYLDWTYIVDRTRNVYRTDGTDTSPEQAIEAAADNYARELWSTQDNHVELWVEKEALAGVVQRAAQELGVHYFACRGYVSQSEMYAAGMRFNRLWRHRNKRCHIIHLGDHDPSGIDMTRDIQDRLMMFGAGHVQINRIALNMDQVEEHNPPPNFAKVTDSRFYEYEREFGDQSWELDALDPATLHDLMVDTVMDLRDEELWQDERDRQETERHQLSLVANQWEAAVEHVYNITEDE